jgi:hypothetical protein
VQNDCSESGGRKDKKTSSGKSTRKNESINSTKPGEAKTVASEGNAKGMLLNWCSKKAYKATFSTANDGTVALDFFA